MTGRIPPKFRLGHDPLGTAARAPDQMYDIATRRPGGLVPIDSEERFKLRGHAGKFMRFAMIGQRRLSRNALDSVDRM